MLKKILLVCCTSLLTVSCGLDYDGNTRNLYKGTVTDEQGNPLSGVPVSIEMYNYNQSEIIAYTYTDAQGNYRIAAPRVKDGLPKVEINKMHSYDVETFLPVYTTSVTYHNINQEALADYTLNLGTTVLNTIQNNVQVNFNFTQTPKKINLLGIVTHNSIDLDFPVYYAGQDVYPFTYYYNDLSTSFNVRKNQTLTLRYMDSNEEVHEELIAVGEVDLTITIP
nr:carboxypeptidase-like regulatory domain-containing protein [uncultured Flavobacterium sp.]